MSENHSFQPQGFRVFERMSRPMLARQDSIVLSDETIKKALMLRSDWFHLISYNDQIYHYRIEPRGVVITPVDALIDSQFLLIYITLLCAFFFAGLSYFVSLWLVKRGLQPLYTLTEHIKQVQDPQEYENLVV